MTIPRSPVAALAAFLAIAPVALAQTPPPAPAKDPAPTAPPAAQPKKTDTPKPAIPPAPKPIAEPTLKVGHKAPDLKPETWVRNGASESVPALSAYEPGKVYVVEFWATWCPSCKEAMPTLAKLARERKDVTIIAVASSERKPKKDAPDERLEGVRRFVKDHDEAMPYAVLFDGARAMASTYLVPAGKIYIPMAFIIDQSGAITWIGDPRERGFDSALNVLLKPVETPASSKPSPAAETPKKPGKTAPKN